MPISTVFAGIPMSIAAPREAGPPVGFVEVESAYADVLDSLSPGRARAAEVRNIAWMIEELRVGTFAQRLGTAHPVSVKRVLSAIRAVR